ncbi:NACHT, LRR and PYD domains-containing protein 12-like isoform X1, partial [Tachysurus ichikawai]
MLPVVKLSRTAEVRNCNLLDKGFQALTTAISSKSSSLRELKLGSNVLHQSGIRILSEGLQSPHCKLEILDLSYCYVTESGCTALALALTLNPSHLKELQLTGNQPGNSGREKLSVLQQHKDYRLEKLK